MIILIGPDGTGKTTLAKRLSLRIHHHTQHSNYMDYLAPLCKLEFKDAVLDRTFFCEFAYASAMKRQFQFTQKQWHNLVQMTLIQKPVIILCTHKPFEVEYDKKQYLPYELWDDVMRLYRELLNYHRIPYMEYDYLDHQDDVQYLRLAITYNAQMTWWREHWAAGYGCAGSPNPKFLLVAERIGPNNMNNIPFETGPTGYMLANMLQATGTPLGVLAITNMVKTYRRDARAVNDADNELLREEIAFLKPQ